MKGRAEVGPGHDKGTIGTPHDVDTSVGDHQ